MHLPWSQPRVIDHEVGGKTLRFFEISGFKTIGLKDLIRAMIESLAQLQRTPREDAGSEETRDMERTDLNAEGKMVFMPKTVTVVKKSAISTDSARYHDDQRKSATQLMISQLISERTYRDLMGFVVASLREEFPEKLTKQEMDQLVEEMPLGTFVECIGGVMKANTKVFGPFEVLVRKAMDSLKDRLAKAGEPQEEDLDLE